jgi:hypothetical protein
MFFVRVNRFWCVWTRVLVIADAVMCLRKLARVFGNGLSDLEAAVKRQVYNCRNIRVFRCMMMRALRL